MANYAEFSITFQSRAGSGYPILVESPSGRAEGVFEPPFAPDQLGAALDAVSASLRAGNADARNVTVQLQGGTASPDASVDWSAPLEGMGAQLFRALFTGNVQRRFDESIGMTSARGDVLRIRLHMDLDNRSVAPLASVPWELLHYPERREFLVQRHGTAVVRYLDVPRAASPPPPFAPPLRILFVMANPRGDLDLARERDEVEARLRGGTIPIETAALEGATYRSLEATLHEQSYHIVHFMGHGGFDGRNGVLLLEGDEGRAGESPITGAEFANLVLGGPSLRLVVLNACRTAEAVQAPGVDPYGGVAPALVMAGVPAVVAMQFPISDAGAVDFAERLYSTLADGDSLEEAVRGGRRVIRHEWPTPVLFSRCESLFAPVAPVTDPSGPAASVRTPSMPAMPLGFMSAPSAAVQTPSQLLASPWAQGGGEVPDLLPYMVDRTEVLFQLTQLLQRQDTTPATPLVAIIHGDDEQCQDKLQQRLAEIELPKLLKLNTRTTRITAYQQAWPKEYRNRADLHARLTWSLAERVRPGASLPELQQLFGSLPAPVMIHSHLLSSEWKRFGEAALEDYLAYWQAWPRDAHAPRVLVFLFLKYQVPDAGWFKGRDARRTNAAIAEALERLSDVRDDGIVHAVLPRLEGITQQDVETWNADHGFPLAATDIRDMFRAYALATKQEAMSMEVAGRQLQELFSHRVQAPGGV